MKVGRSALDQEAIQLIESLNPDIEFDWSRILKGETTERQTAAPEKARGRGSARARGKRDRPAAPRVSSESQAAAVPAPSAAAAEEAAADQAERADAAEAPGDHDDVPVAPAEETLPGPDELTAPPVTAAHDRLGGEAVSRLRARYAEIRARIEERISDPARQEELYALAERLNPDGWVTGDEVARALDEYESVLAAIRASVGLSRRRRRRRSRRDGPAGAVASGAPGPAPADANGTEDASAPEETDGVDSDGHGS